MPAFRCEFLGCKVNQYDAERARAALLAACTVTARAARKGQRALRKQLREEPELRVAVLGCLTEEDRAFYHALGGRVTLLPSATDARFTSMLAPLAEELAELCRAAGFAKLHLFGYSPRDGTAAARFDGARAGYDERYHRIRIAPCDLRRGDVARVRVLGGDGETLLANSASETNLAIEAETVDAA